MEDSFEHKSLMDKVAPFNAERVSSFNDLYLNLRLRTAFYKGKSIRLTPKEYQILWLLIRANGSLLSTIEMGDFLYDESLEVENHVNVENVLSGFIKNLREKLNYVSQGNIRITNYHSAGYFLELA